VHPVIRTLNLMNKNITLYAGTAIHGYVNGIATVAQFDYPFGITIDNINTSGSSRLYQSSNSYD